MLKWNHIKLLITGLLTFTYLSVSAQRCAQQAHMDSVFNAFPEQAVQYQLLQDSLLGILKTNEISNQDPLTIPVVFHVLYHADSQNISDEQILTQLQVLNEDFNRLNVDTLKTPARFKPFAADFGISFCLAQQTPDGLPTTGIIRQYTPVPQIGNTNNYYKPTEGGTQIWDPRYYLNVWICDITETTLGFTYLPGTGQPNYDGIVLHFKATGTIGTVSPPYHKGRTLVHEVGHWLNLQHPWGPEDGCQFDDGVTDTPVQESATSGCPDVAIFSCNNEPLGDMYPNYMDYTYDDCQNLFTTGQKNRVFNTLNSTRKLLYESVGCQPPDTTSPVSNNIDLFPNPVQSELTMRCFFEKETTVEVYIYSALGVLVKFGSYTLETGRVTMNVSDLARGAYIVEIRSPLFSVTKKITIAP